MKKKLGRFLKKIIAIELNSWVALTIIGIFIFFCLDTEAISQSDSHFYRMLLAGISVVFLVIFFILKKKWHSFAWPWSKKNKVKPKIVAQFYFTSLILAAIFGVFNYFQFNSQVFGGISDYYDISYYYTNSKYFEELGYYNLYEAMLIADEENQNRLSYIKEYRDLETYKIIPNELAFFEKKAIKDKFSKARWEQFKSDVDFLIQKNNSAGWQYFFIDHGYNPPPTWTIVGKTLSEIIDIENLKWITMIDFALVVIMFFVIAKSFGLEAMLFSLLFFVTTFSGRWPILGQSLLRFDWLVALVLSVCALKSKKYFSAGGLLAYSGLSRIFPIIFFVPYIFKFFSDLWQKRSLAKEHKRFLAGAATVTLLIIISALISFGSKTFSESKNNLLMHNSPTSYSSHRVGLGDALFFRGETTKKEMQENGAITGKSKQIADILPWLYICGLVSMVFIGIYIIRNPKPTYQLIALASIPLFCLTNPQINYYNLRILLILWHINNANSWLNYFGLVWLFSIEIIAQATKIVGFTRYTTTTISSIGLAIYFLVILLFLIAKAINPEKNTKHLSKLTSL